MKNNKFSLAIVVGILLSFLLTTPVMAILYGSGTYGTCTFTSCSITITTSGTVNLDVSVPTSGGSCTTQKDTVAVTTHSGTGYNLTASNSSTDTSLANVSGDIPASSGTMAAVTITAINRPGQVGFQRRSPRMMAMVTMAIPTAAGVAVPADQFL